MHRENCWEVKNCGRQVGGDQVDALGECPASSAVSCHGINKGINGGRACWAIAGTMCGGKVQGLFAEKLKGCANCDFFHLVLKEEGENLATVQEIIKKLNSQ